MGPRRPRPARARGVAGTAPCTPLAPAGHGEPARPIYGSEPIASSRPCSIVWVVAYRIAQEAIENVRRHSQASSVWVALEADASTLHVTVADDGIGIDRGVTDQAARRHRGVSAMRQRAELEGGRLEIGPRPNGGTRIEFWLPLRPAAED